MSDPISLVGRVRGLPVEWMTQNQFVAAAKALAKEVEELVEDRDSLLAQVNAVRDVIEGSGVCEEMVLRIKEVLGDE